jgi:hypothetical protein
MAEKEPKPGYKTSEFWLTAVAMIVALLLASGALTNELMLQVAGIIASALAALGYDYSRGKAKSGDNT